MIIEKETVRVKRKFTELPCSRGGKPAMQYRVCTRYTPGPQIEYFFDHGETEFDIPTHHAEMIMRDCDMALVSTGKEVIKSSKAKAKADAKS